jgi:hypothetical protein
LFVTVTRNSGESPAFTSTADGETAIEGALATHAGGAAATTVTPAVVERDKLLVVLRARMVSVRVPGAKSTGTPMRSVAAPSSPGSSSKEVDDQFRVHDEGLLSVNEKRSAAQAAELLFFTETASSTDVPDSAVTDFGKTAIDGAARVQTSGGSVTVVLALADPDFLPTAPLAVVRTV